MDSNTLLISSLKPVGTVWQAPLKPARTLAGRPRHDASGRAGIGRVVTSSHQVDVADLARLNLLARWKSGGRPERRHARQGTRRYQYQTLRGPGRTTNDRLHGNLDGNRCSSYYRHCHHRYRPDRRHPCRRPTKASQGAQRSSKLVKWRFSSVQDSHPTRHRQIEMAQSYVSN